MLCGGDQDKNCLELTETGGNFAWTPYATAKDARKDHVSWVSPRGLVLIGGDGNEDAELITPGEVGQLLFDLSKTTQRYEFYYNCKAQIRMLVSSISQILMSMCYPAFSKTLWTKYLPNIFSCAATLYFNPFLFGFFCLFVKIRTETNKTKFTELNLIKPNQLSKTHQT